MNYDVSSFRNLVFKNHVGMSQILKNSREIVVCRLSSVSFRSTWYLPPKMPIDQLCNIYA